jgi:predicted secreted protein
VRVEVELKDFEKLQRDLATFAKRSVPYATRTALTKSAFALREAWQGEIKRSFITRNRYTERSIRVEPATSLNMATMQAATGSVAEYMGEQEFGGNARRAIPGSAAAGQKPGSKRTRLVRAGNKLGALHALKPSVKGKGSKKRRNAAAIAQAIAKGNKVALLERKKGGKGLFAVAGGKRKVRLRMLWDVSNRSFQVKPEPTLQRSLAHVRSKLEAIHYSELTKQLRRNRVFGY